MGRCWCLAWGCLKDCEQGTVLRSLLAGEKRWMGVFCWEGTRKKRVWREVAGFCFARWAGGRLHAEPPVGRWVVGPEPGRPVCPPSLLSGLHLGPSFPGAWTLSFLPTASSRAGTPWGADHRAHTLDALWDAGHTTGAQYTSNEGESSHGDPVDTAGFWAASGQWRLAWCPLRHSPGLTES